MTSSTQDIDQSSLFDEKTFYPTFLKDLLNCQNEVIIESPYITHERMKVLIPIFNDLLSRNVKICIITRDPREHTRSLAIQSEIEIQRFERMGVRTLLCPGSHHRKLAILDRKILWEGSLNILSQVNSKEIMRRIDSEALATEMFEFLNFEKYF